MSVTAADRRDYDGPRESIAGAFALDDELTNRLRRAAEEAFGSGLTQTDLAERIAAVVDGKPRRAAYWLNGESPIPAAVIDKLEAAVARKRELDPDGALAKLINDWRAAGLHDELIVAALQFAGDGVSGRTIS